MSWLGTRPQRPPATNSSSLLFFPFWMTLFSLHHRGLLFFDHMLLFLQTCCHNCFVWLFCLFCFGLFWSKNYLSSFETQRRDIPANSLVHSYTLSFLSLSLLKTRTHSLTHAQCVSVFTRQVKHKRTRNGCILLYKKMEQNKTLAQPNSQPGSRPGSLQTCRTFRLTNSVWRIRSWLLEDKTCSWISRGLNFTKRSILALQSFFSLPVELSHRVEVEIFLESEFPKKGVPEKNRNRFRIRNVSPLFSIIQLIY